MVLFETMELLMSLAGVVSMSPAKRSHPAALVIQSAAILERPSKSQKATQRRWAEDMEWICFRTTDPGNHIGTTLKKRLMRSIHPVKCQKTQDVPVSFAHIQYKMAKT
jgi:hypothetical protein